MYSEKISALNANTKEERLAALKYLKSEIDSGKIEKPAKGIDINNHIHTIYSFSPYSPARAVWESYRAGLLTAGIVDHDSVAGVEEFIEAGKILEMPTTIGFELRVTHSATALGDVRTNNPDQNGVSYITFHGIPHTKINTVSEFLKPINKARGLRNRKMCDRLSEIFDIKLDYENEILPLSQKGGSVTERHLLFALAKKLIKLYGREKELFEVLQKRVELNDKFKAQMLDKDNLFFEYDLLGFLKAFFVSEFYLPANIEECPDIRDVVKFVHSHGIIATYPYLGDIKDSVTGDKKAQLFEDSYLDKLFDVLHEIGIQAVSYMPTRNTIDQLKRLRALCEKYQMFEISGEDINSPRQSFVCLAMRDPLFANLTDSAWALIGHERAATDDIKNSFINLNMSLQDKIKYFINYLK